MRECIAAGERSLLPKWKLLESVTKDRETYVHLTVKSVLKLATANNTI
jgi:hypothetical protein